MVIELESVDFFQLETITAHYIRILLLYIGKKEWFYYKRGEVDSEVKLRQIN